MCQKKNYYIHISGESCASTIKSLTDDEYNLIYEIFEECESEYVSGVIHELPDIDMLYDRYHISEMLNPNIIDIEKMIYLDKENYKFFKNALPVTSLACLLYVKYKKETCAK